MNNDIFNQFFNKTTTTLFDFLTHKNSIDYFVTKKRALNVDFKGFKYDMTKLKFNFYKKVETKNSFKKG